MALGDVRLPFTWQVWHLMTSTCVLRGKRGAWRRLPLFHVAGVALGDIYLCFVWQAWHLVTSTCVLRGRRPEEMSLVCFLVMSPSLMVSVSGHTVVEAVA